MRTSMDLLWLPVGLAVSLLASRRPRVALLVTLGLFTFLITFGVLVGITAPTWLVALGAAAAPVLGVELARRWQRPFLPPLLLVAMMAASIGLTRLRTMPRLAVVLLALVGVGLLVAGTWRAPWGVRLVFALLGARFALLALPWTQPWALLGVAAVLFAASTLVSRGATETEPPPAPAVRTWAGSLAATVLIAVLGTALLAPELPAPTDVLHQARLQQLKAKAPSGGLLWSSPSEALTWEGNHPEFPAFENLDALYLAGRQVTLAKVPGTSALTGAFWLIRPMTALRVKKAPEELAALRDAAQFTVQALKDSLPLYRPGVTEQAIAQAIHDRQIAHGAEGDSFPLIVASGPRGAKPHAFALDGTLKAGELVVTDIGSYKDHYASDFTRTLPVGGKFDPRGRKQYAAVYAGQQAALKACKPGASLYGKAKDGGQSLDAISREAMKAAGVDSAYPHGLGHTVGLFVHDVGGLGLLEPGMVVTIEPGLYIPGELGIRIEDTYLVTETGCEQITTGFPADPDSVEAIMAGGKLEQAAQGAP